MKVIVFGATGMVGQAALRASLLDADVTKVLTVGRTATGTQDPKLEELAHPDLANLEPIAGKLAGYDACFFCLGVSSTGMNEADYSRVTYDFTVAVARTLARLNPQMTFVFVSGRGTDETEKSSTMWARVKGKAENAVRAAGFKEAYMFRPALIIPQHGIRSRTRAYRIAYTVLWPVLPLFQLLMPTQVLTTDQLGQAFLNAAKKGAPKPILEVPDLLALAKG